MSDAPAQEVDAEGAPQGRSTPGGGKIAGFPWWVWVLAAGGTFAVVWYMKGKSGSVVSSTQTGSSLGPGSAVGTTNSSGVSLTDPMTAAALLQAMQDLATRLGATSVSPAPPSPTPQPGGSSTPVVTVPPATAAFSSSHVTGGSSTNNATVPGLPAIPVPAVIATSTPWVPPAQKPYTAPILVTPPVSARTPLQDKLLGIIGLKGIPGAPMIPAKYTPYVPVNTPPPLYSKPSAPGWRPQ
jgi:hypothetical protein